METHSSILAWRIPWIEEPGGPCPWGHRESDTTEVTKHGHCFIDYAKAFDYVDHHKLWKIRKEMGIPNHLTWLLRNLHAGQEAQLKPDMEQQAGSKEETEYIKAV